MRWLSVWLALQQAVWIDVPYVRQDKNGCGSAVIWMVMEYWKAGAAPRVEEIQAQLYSEEAGGIYASDMEKYLRTRGYQVFSFRGTWDDLAQHVAKGRPLIVCLERNARGVPLHYVVVAGVDAVRNLVLVNDPAQRKLLSISRAEFERSWKATDNWTLLAVPEIELAGIAFREEKLTAAKEHLSSALESNPSDAYTNDFLATVYFLQNNLESALKYWNRAGKPKIDNISFDPPLRTNPVLLDRAFSFSRGSVLTLDDFRTTLARLDATGVFSRRLMELSPTEGGRFDLTVRAAERNGPNLLSWFSGLPYQTVYPEALNLGARAINVKSLLRWDSNKRRAHVSLAAPLKGNPKWGLRVSLDARKENWVDVAETFRMSKREALAEFHSVPNGRWNWTSGVAVSRREFSNSFSAGLAVKYLASLTRAVIRDSDRRLEMDSSVSVQAGKLFAADLARFGKAESRLALTWLPFSDRRDYEVNGEWRIGRTFGRPPFDERFVLGLDRDSDLRLRAHSDTAGGLKNAQLAATSFFITNTNFQKVVSDTGFVRVSAGPFLDTARRPISPQWLADTGLQVQITALGSITLHLSYGTSLTGGSHAFFISAPR